MALSARTIEFNKEIIIGEIGATVGAPVLGQAASLFTHVADIISAFAVIGSILGGALFFLSLRWHHKKKAGHTSKTGFVTDLAYFTPAALVIALIVSYPTLFFLSRFLQTLYSPIVSVIVSQVTAFLLFMIAINTYRYLLSKHTGKVL